MKPFVVLTLPCSRDAWLAAFLSYGRMRCLYNVSLDLHSIEQLDRLLATPWLGIVDTSLAMLWPEIVDRAPHARLVTVRRPMAQVAAEMQSSGLAPAIPALRRIDFALNEIESLSNVLRVEYSKLDEEDTARRLFEFCLPYPFDKDWWEAGRKVPVEVPVASLAAKAVLNERGYVNTFGKAIQYYDGRLAERAP